MQVFCKPELVAWMAEIEQIAAEFREFMIEEAQKDADGTADFLIDCYDVVRHYIEDGIVNDDKSRTFTAYMATVGIVDTIRHLQEWESDNEKDIHL